MCVYGVVQYGERSHACVHNKIISHAVVSCFFFVNPIILVAYIVLRILYDVIG